MKTIGQRFQDFRTRVIHPEAPEMQVREMRIAFYAGFLSMLDVNLTLAMFNEELAIVELEKLHIEARRFFDLLHQQQGEDE